MTYTSPTWLARAPEFLRPALESTHQWSLGIEGGVQADFADIDLSDVDKGILHIAAKRGAKFMGATVSGMVQTKEPVFMQLAPWPVLIFDTHALLGCQEFSIDHLPALTEEEIMTLDLQPVENSFAAEWWETNRQQIIETAAAHQEA